MKYYVFCALVITTILASDSGTPADLSERQIITKIHPNLKQSDLNTVQFVTSFEGSDLPMAKIKYTLNPLTYEQQIVALSRSEADLLLKAQSQMIPLMLLNYLKESGSLAKFCATPGIKMPARCALTQEHVFEVFEVPVDKADSKKQ